MKKLIVLAAFLACTIWVCYEVHDFQKLIDVYNEEYVEAHLAWRSTELVISHPRCAHGIGRWTSFG